MGRQNQSDDLAFWIHGDWDGSGSESSVTEYDDADHRFGNCTCLKKAVMNVRDVEHEPV